MRFQAPRELDRSAPWPPAPADSDEQTVVIVNTRDQAVRVKARVVTLWGQRVAIDQAGRVYCDYCKQFVPIADLAAVDNPHGVGLPPIPGAFRPAPDEPTPSRWLTGGDS